MSVDKEFEEDFLEGVLAEAAAEASVAGAAETRVASSKAKKKAVTKRVVTKEPHSQPGGHQDIVLGADRGGGKVGQVLTNIEKRFLSVTGLGSQTDVHGARLQVKTDKDKSDAHGEVFTPLWLAKDMVDHLVLQGKKKNLWKQDEKQELTTEDLCAGYGQFTLSILRSKYDALGEDFKITKFLSQTHLFIELQPNSCYRLLSIFGTGIRLLMGNAAKKSLVPENAEKGVWAWSEEKGVWLDATQRVKDWVKETNARYPKDKWAEKAAYFEGRVDEWLTNLGGE